MSVSGIGSRLPYAPPTGVPTPAPGGPKGEEVSSGPERSAGKVSSRSAERTTPTLTAPVPAEAAARAVERENVAAADARSLGYHEANSLLARLVPQRQSLDVQL
jgi:hypothetical protein